MKRLLFALAGATGTMTARYPLMHTGDPTPDWTTILVGGSGPGVTVKLIQNSECIPHPPVVVSELGPSSSSGHFCTPCSEPFDPLDFVNHAYCWQVMLTRATTATRARGCT